RFVWTSNFEEGTTIWDVSGDSIAKHTDSRAAPFAMSPNLNRLFTEYDKEHMALRSWSDLSVIALIPFQYYTQAWFDESRGKLYRTVQWGIEEYDAETGLYLRGTATKAPSGIVRRPPESEWLFYFPKEIGDNYPYNFATAIHLETAENVEFF